MMLSPSPYQLVLAVVALLFIGDRLVRAYRHEQGQSLFKTVTIIVVWCVVLVISLFPTGALFISEKLGMGSNLNTLIFSGFIFVFVVLFRILGIIERNEQQITEIVRKVALKDVKKIG